MPDAQALIEQHGDAVWRIAVRLLGDTEDAKDCYQETFLAAIRLTREDAVKNWSALLKRIATCRALDRLRQRYRRRESRAELDQIPGHDRRVDDPAARLEAMELRREVREALGGLPERQAEAFWLRHMEQLSPDEIAAQLDTTAANARQLVHRATAALRDRLAPKPTLRPVPESEGTVTGGQR